MTINWPTLTNQAVMDAEAELERLRVGWYEQQEHVKTLRQYRDNPALTRPSIKVVGDGSTSPHWVVWIPPHHADHFEGDTILGPWGDTYFDEIGDATAFLSAVLHDMEGDSIESAVLLSGGTVTELPTTMPLRFKVGADVRSWTEFELADATEAEVSVLEQENDEAVALARTLYEAGRLVEHNTETDDNPDIFDTEHADSAVLDVEVITKED